MNCELIYLVPVVTLLNDVQLRHKSMLEYLHANNFTDAFNALKADTNIDYNPEPKSKYAGLLEKKWTSVIRLQKKALILACYLFPS
jgi:platelet-activating factor acetylhydrolase IB subunit alpha